MTDTNNNKFAELALARYTDICERIRAWLIIYGVSVPALFITQATELSNVSTKIKLLVLIPSFTGALIQLALVISVKYSNLYMFKGLHELEPLSKTTLRYRWADWWAQAVWIDIVVDVLTVIAYMGATGILIYAMTQA